VAYSEEQLKRSDVKTSPFLDHFDRENKKIYCTDCITRLTETNCNQ
jgi:hypothetical protein